MTARRIEARAWSVVSLALAVMALAAPVRLAAQISPGPLAKVHAELEGALNCVRCHGPRREAMTGQCQSCHREIGWLVQQNRGLHATRESRTRECADCHPDHAGAGFALIAWPGGSAERFDHREAGWTLEGSHVGLDCGQCHTTAYRTSPAAGLSKRSAGAGWVGLETTCASCHRDDDAHRGALKGSCATCHDARDWKPAAGFSHDDTDYPLTGKHAGTACGACHLSPRLPLSRDAGGEPIPVYAPVPFQTCASCHDDPHAGRFSSSCTECHSTSSFAIGTGRSFNHARTRYPLRGRHARVECAACHGPDLTTAKPAFERCESCHSDPHGSEAGLAGKPADCAACHGVDGFTPSIYTVDQHATAPYPLEGRHREVACVTCHVPTAPVARPVAARPARLRMPFGRCTDCHVDAHARQLATRPDGGACEGCHTVAGFAPSTFGDSAHGRLRLALEGRHAEIPCRACHAGNRAGLPAPAPRESLGTAGVAVRLSATACASCHVDPHAGRYEAAGAMPVEGGCATCHDARAFTPSRLDAAGHDRFTFRLRGAHLAVSCSGCHDALGRSPARATLLRTASAITPFPVPGTARACAACHESPHGDQFAARSSTGCESCHGVESFASAPGFNHDRDAAFPLAGAHAKVACSSCHVARVIDGASMTVYRPLSSRCESCHDRAYQ